MYRSYNIALLGLIFLAVLSLFCLGSWMEPPWGDLTRLGGYPERYYGWNGPLYAFFPPLAQPAAVDGRYDIVVFGDSFSGPTTPDRTRVGGYWTDFLVADIGPTVGVSVFYGDLVQMRRYIETETFQARPPKVLVLERVERDIISLTDHAAPGCPILSSGIGFGPVLSPIAVLPHDSRRDTSFRPSSATIDMATDFLNKNVPSWLFGWDSFFGSEPTQVFRLPLSRRDLFSSREPSHLLVYYTEMRKAKWSVRDWTNIACQLSLIQAEVEGNGRTLFVVVVVPDKSSAYAPYLSPEVQQPNALEVLAQVPGLHLLRLDLALGAAISAGTKDVYLPDDTHWGSQGARIAACTLADYLSGQNASHENDTHRALPSGSNPCDPLPNREAGAE